MSISPASTLDLLTPILDEPVKLTARKPWKNKASVKAWYAKHREQLSPDDVVVFDHGAIPGEVVTVEVIEKQNERYGLIALINRFACDGLSWDEGCPGKITPDTAAAATGFFGRLNQDYQIPKMAPDGEGGLMLVWEGCGDPVVGVIDNWRLHLVAGAGTPHAQYVDDVAFDGENIPEQILSRIPLS